MKPSSKEIWHARAEQLYNPEFLSELPDSFVLPQYNGLSIANIPASVGKLLGVNEGWASPALDDSILKCLPNEVDRVILMVVDGLPWQHLMQQLNKNEAGFADLFSKYGLCAEPITSISPSTTSVATTVLTGNGACAAETGMMGYKYLMAEQGLVANVLFWKPDGDPTAVAGALESWGIKPETFLSTASSAQVLKQADIETRIIMPAAYSHSPLSRMQMRDANIDGYMNATDMWLKLQSWLQETKDKKAYAYTYYADFDSLSHRDSHENPIWSALWEEFCFQLKRFYTKLKDNKNTLFLMTADHGHIHTPLQARQYLKDHQPLLDMCSVSPGGEPRQVYLYARHGAKDDILAYAKTHLAEQFVVLDAQDALKNGLYGNTQKLHPEASRRLGDVVLLSKGQNYLWDGPSDKILLGKHGGLELDEMLVPFIAFSLD